VFFLLVVSLLVLLPVTALAAVQNATVAVYPLSPGVASQFTIGFNVTSSGALEAGKDKIIIEFPDGTTIPSSIGSGKILINGKSVSSSYIYVDDNVLTLKLPSDIDIKANGYAGIIIPQSAGIKTPLKGGTHYLIISTTRDGAASSNSFTLEGTKVSSLEVSVSPAAVDEYAEYEISFKTSSKGALTGGEDYIYIEFPDEVDLPRSISSSYIKVNGVKPSSSGVNVDRDTNTLAIKVPSDIKNSTKVTINISSSADIRNPDDPGKYELGVYTSKDSLLVEDEYSVGLSISTPVVTVSPGDGGKNSQYSIGFTTSSDGALTGGVDYIYLYFPSGTYIPSSINSSYVTVNGYAAKSVSCVRSERKISIRLPSNISIQDNSYVGVVIKSGAGVKNPSSGGKYRLEVSTTADSSKVKSQEYTITGTSSSATKPTVALSTNKTGEYPTITIEYELGFGYDLEGDYDEITIVFPDEFSLPNSLSKSDITIEGEMIADYDIDDNELVLTVPKDIDGGDEVEIIIKSSARIKNPTKEGSYTLEIYTSQDSSKVESKSFTIGSASTIELCQVELSNYTAGQDPRYFISIFASEEWNLQGGDSIIITFPAGTTVPSSISTSYIKINDEYVEDVSVNNRTVTIELPEDIDEGDKIVVEIAESAGIKNPNTPGSYKLEVGIPGDDDLYESKAYEITSSNVTATGNKIIFRIGSKLCTDRGTLVNLDAAPTIIDNFTVVPLRALGNALGAETAYDASTNSVTVKYKGKELYFLINSKLVRVDNQWMTLDVPATIINGRVMIPVRFVSQSYGAIVDWNADTQQITITN
jgi:hypothetical protein